MKQLKFLFLLLLTLGSQQALAGMTKIQIAQKATENQVRNLLVPVLDRYCRDECKLLSVTTTVDVAIPDEVAPGFDDIDPQHAEQLSPSSATVKLLIDEQLGPVSRKKLLDLIQQYMDTLDFVVKIDAQSAHFPMASQSAGKIAEMRERVLKQFKQTLDDLFNQFCPRTCLLGDLNLKTDTVNPEEAQFSQTGEYIVESGIALKITDLSAAILVDNRLSPEEQKNIVEMARIRTQGFRNVNLTSKAISFPRSPEMEQEGYIAGINGTKSKSNSENSQKKESSESDQTTQSQQKFEKYEKIERVENGDALQSEFTRIRNWGLALAAVLLGAIAFLVFAATRPEQAKNLFSRNSQWGGSKYGSEDYETNSQAQSSEDGGGSDRTKTVVQRYEIERLRDELLAIFAQQPKVAKQVFTRILTEEGVEVTACYIHIFGESVVMDMLRDPSLQTDLNELMEYYAKTPIELKTDEQLELLKKLHSRTVSGKLVVMGSRSSHQFDFLSDMDGQQILELIRNESLTVKSIVVTQCDPQKRSAIFTQLDEQTRMKLLSELSRIDYLPKDYITNVASALKRKRHENPRLNTEALPGSEVLVNLLERTGLDLQLSVLKDLEKQNPESARIVKNKLVSLQTLPYLRDGQLLEVVLSLKHDELLQFLKGASDQIRGDILSRAPRDLSGELEEELAQCPPVSREAYQNIERKIVNRIKVMSNEGLINLNETNERMFTDTQKKAPNLKLVPTLAQQVAAQAGAPGTPPAGPQIPARKIAT